MLKEHERAVYSVAWGKGRGGDDERSLGWVASTGGDGRINVWNVMVWSVGFFNFMVES